MAYICASKNFKSLEAAKVFAEAEFQKSGIVLGIVKKLPKSKKSKRFVEARIQCAVGGFVIPMMSIPALYRAMEAAVVADASLTELKSIVAGWPGVKESA